MKISVILATYNGEKYLAEQLDSIREQTVPVDEVVVCDDCSTDGTVAALKEYIGRYGLEEKWHVYENESNLGYANNFRKAADLATGDFLFFSDQDDTWDLRKIEIMLDEIQKRPECCVLCTDYNLMYEGQNVPQAPKDVLKKMPNNGVTENVVLSKRSVYIGAIGCCMCVRKTFYDSISEYWFDAWAQDDRMWRLAQCAGGCVIMHKNLINHRIHTNNTSTFGKYHTLERRIKLFKAMQEANLQMLKMLEAEGKVSEQQMMSRHIDMMELRIDLLEHKHLTNVFKLIKYLPYYQKKTSLLVEVYIAMKAKK